MKTIVLLCALAAIPTLAHAQNAEATARIEVGLHAVSNHQLDAAIDAFRTAGQLEPSRAEAWCLLAGALRAHGDASRDAFEACRLAAGQAADSHWLAVALHGLASGLEREPDRLLEAPAAWERYVAHAERNPDVASAQIGRSRIVAIDQKLPRRGAHPRRPSLNVRSTFHESVTGPK
jgi:hypothetical protein